MPYLLLLIYFLALWFSNYVQASGDSSVSFQKVSCCLCFAQATLSHKLVVFFSRLRLPWMLQCSLLESCAKIPGTFYSSFIEDPLHSRSQCSFRTLYTQVEYVLDKAWRSFKRTNFVNLFWVHPVMFTQGVSYWTTQYHVPKGDKNSSVSVW